MSIAEILNQKPRLALPGEPRTVHGVDIALCLTQDIIEDIGVKTEAEKELLEGYLIVLGKSARVYISIDYMYG